MFLAFASVASNRLKWFNCIILQLSFRKFVKLLENLQKTLNVIMPLGQGTYDKYMKHVLEYDCMTKTIVFFTYLFGII